MKKRILFGILIFALISANIVFSFPCDQININLSEMLKLPQANAEWPYDGTPCSTYTSYHWETQSGCLKHSVSDLSCNMGIAGGCYSGRITTWTDVCSGYSETTDGTSYISCGN